jgi:2-succinyl-6-hydroxy-2,4-cyclohexadiene-1-carboxylate synthase
MGAGAQDDLLPRLHEIDVPTLFLAGALDQRYAALAPVMAAEVPGAEHRIIPDAGHTTHLEQPDAFGQVVTAFLGRHRPDA